MKKIFDRLRRWLIKKLGGYTEQFTPVRHKVIRLPDARAKKVQVQVIVYGPALYGHIDIEKYLKKRAIESIVRCLEENGYIKWEKTDDIEKCSLVFRATIWVVSPENLEPSYQSWVETHAG